jgi:hypothetical protein
MKIDLYKQRREVERRAGIQSQKIVHLDGRFRGPQNVLFASMGAITQAAYQRFRERERGVGIYRNKSELQKQPQLALN